jgi:hypothetical protein
MEHAWSYALGNETRVANSALEGQATSDRYFRDLLDRPNLEDDSSSSDSDLAARDAASQVMRRFEHLLQYDSVADLVEAGLLTVEQWCEVLDRNTERRRQATLLRPPPKPTKRLYGTCFLILEALEKDSPMTFDDLFAVVSSERQIRATVRDEMVKMAKRGLVFYRPDNDMVRITELGHLELQHRRGLRQASA